MNNTVSKRQKTFGVIGIIVGLIWLAIRVFYLPLSYSDLLDFAWPIIIIVLSFLYFKGKIPAQKKK